MKTTTYSLKNGTLKVQIEDLIPKRDWEGWVYQAPGVGNKGAEGAHYYYRSQTAEGSLKKAPATGQFSFSVEVDDPGAYSILLRAVRDTNKPGDARNDIWIRVDGDTQSVMPAGTAELTSGGNGFVKFKGASTAWKNARQFSTETTLDVNPASTVVFDKGVHEITFAPRSIGFHIDSVQVVRVGDVPKGGLTPNKTPAKTPSKTISVDLDDDPHVTVFLGHDGYRDADDNLSLLIGTAQAVKSAAKNASIDVAGVIFGDVKDGGQYYMLNPTGKAPRSFGTDDRFGDVAGNKKAAGNYAFFQKYGVEALKDLDPNLATYDLPASDKGGLRAWNFDATKKSQITDASAALAEAIIAAIKADAGSKGSVSELVVYSAGGGANVAGEAIGFLLNKGYSKADIAAHFAVTQHGNWEKSYEAEARELTRDMTIAISDQNMATYRNGADGPDLKHAIKANSGTGAGLGSDFAEAIAVATGKKAFAGLPNKAVFATTKDASDAGSHAFATNLDALLAAWESRLGKGTIHTDDQWGHLIDDGGSTRARVIWNGFDADDVKALLSSGKIASKSTTSKASGQAAQADDGGSKTVASAGTQEKTASGTIVATISSGIGDIERFGGSGSDDLELGAKTKAGGSKSNPVGLSFDGFTLDGDAEIEAAYLRFRSEETSTSKGRLKIAVEDGLSSKSFAKLGLGGRDWLDDSVTWQVGSWKDGRVYRSPDISDLLEQAIDGDIGAKDALVFRISGTGHHSAHSFESGFAPELVIEYA